MNSRKFSGDWTTVYTQNWVRWLKPYVGKPDIFALEVGCFEGRSSCWFCDNILTGKNSGLTCVDKFAKYKKRMIEPIFDNNIVGLPITKIKGNSSHKLAELVLQGKKYHFIYIDGDHHRTQVLIDFVNCWQLIMPGGIIICDDYQYAGVKASTSAVKKVFKYGIKEIEITPRLEGKRRQIVFWKNN